MRFWIFELALWSSCLFAFVKGGRPERLVALIILLGVAFSHEIIRPLAQRYHGLEAGVMVVDVLTFVALAGVAIWSRRNWTLWITALQGTAIMSHLVSFASPDVIAWTYSNAVQLWIYPILLTLTLGTWAHLRRASAISPSSPA